MNEKIFHSPDSTNEPCTQKELAQNYGITQQTMNNYMRLAKAIPELEDLVDEDDSLKQGIYFCKVEINLCSKF